MIWKTFNKENKKLIGPGSVLVFLKHLELQILKNFQSLGVGVGVGVGLMDLAVCSMLYIYIYIYIYISLSMSTMGNRLLKCLINCMHNAILRYQFVIYSTKKVKIK